MFKLPNLYYFTGEEVCLNDEIKYTYVYTKKMVTLNINFDVQELTGDDYNITKAYCLNLPESINGFPYEYDSNLKGYVLPERVQFIKRIDFNEFIFEGSNKNLGFQELLGQNEDIEIIVRNKSKNSKNKFKYKLILEKIDE